MKTKLFLSFVFVLSGFLAGCAWRPSPEEQAAGDWSEPVNGLRGRLLFGKDEMFNGTRLATVYLKLQNVSDILSPIEISPEHSLRCAVFDASGKPVAQADGPADIWMPLPYWIILPYDSALKFRVSVNGYGISKNAGLAIGLSFPDNWIISPTVRGDYYLSGTFASSPASDSFMAITNTVPSMVWHGVLKLPKVKIPASSASPEGL